MSDTEKTDAVPQKEEAEENKSMVEKKEEEMETETASAVTKPLEVDGKEDNKMEEVETKTKTEPVQTPKKSPKKKKVVEEEEDEDDDDEEELPLGLLERPVVIESGKREKRKVERLAMTMTFTPSNQKKKVDVPEGSGVKLGDCPRIENKIQLTKTEELKTLHRIIFSKKGSHMEVKRNLRQFNGFSFSKEDKEYEKKLVILGKMTLPVLKGICRVLDLETNGLKDNLVQRVMEFLIKPEDSGKPVPVPKSKKRGKAKGEKKTKGEKRKRAEKKEGNKKKKKVAKEESDSEEAGEDEDEENEDEEGDEDVEEDEDASEEQEDSEEEQAPKKKKAKLETPKKPKSDEKKENDKKSEKKEKSVKKAEKKEPKKKKVEVSSDDEDSDDSSSGKKTGPPNNDELRDVVKKILDGANLEEVTMKTVVKQVYAKYPEFDLSDKKDFIKITVKQLIS